MEVKPGYKLTEVGVIPEEWEVKLCSELCIKIQDGTHFSPRLGGNDYLYVTSKNIGFGTLDTSTAEQISAEEHKKIYQRCDVRQGDLLLTKDGANTGNATINPLTEEFSLLSSVALLRFDARTTNAGYFLQQILSQPGQRQIKDEMAGNAITRLTLEKIKKLRFLVPPLAEQQAIVAVLRDVDALIGSLDRLIAKKRDLKQAAMQQLLTGQTRLPGFDKSTGMMKQSDVGLIPEDWNVKALRDITIKVQDGTHFSPTLGGNEYLYVTSKNISFGVLDVSDAEQISASEHEKIYARCDVKKGDLLLTKDGANTGNAALNTLDEPFSLLSSVAFLRFDPRRHHATFFMYQILSRQGQQRIQERMSGNAITRLTLAKIKALRFPTTTIKEQTAISEILSDMDAEIEALEKRRDKTRLLKQGMMQELLNGRTRLV
jgi:type I restriction enzyme, S subunit